MNTDKLLVLLDQHQARQSSYRLMTARYRSAADDVAKQQAQLTVEVEDLASCLVIRPVDELAKVAADDLAAAGISDSQFRRLLAGKRLVERLQTECETLASELKQGQALVDRLLEYARQHGETVQQ